MPTEYRTLMNLANIKCLILYIDDTIVTEGTKHALLYKVREVMKIFDEANIQLKAEKRMITQESIERLGYILTRTCKSPINSKAQGIDDRLRPPNLKQRRTNSRSSQSIQQVYTKPCGKEFSA